jgi:DNA-binding transcriptional ArsR family regulator
MMRINEKEYSRYFKAIGDPNRFRILSFLSGGEKTVGEVGAALGLTQSTVSRHLSILRGAGFVSDRRKGQNVFYRLEKNAVSDCCQVLCLCLKIPRKPGPGRG